VPTRRIAASLVLVALALAACSNTSSNPGASSEAASAPATQFVHVHGLAVDKTGTLWVATHRGLIKQEANGWIYASMDRNDYMGFTVDPATGTLYRSGHPENGGTLGVESSVSGSSWRHLTDVLNPPADFHAMTLSYAHPKIMYGWDSGGRGFFISRDAGATWSPLKATGLNDPTILSLAAPKVARVVFAATASGLFRSADEGASFTPVSAMREAVSAIACDPSNPKHLLAYAQSGMKVSHDGGATWQPTIQGIAPGGYVGAIAISPTNSMIAYASVATTLYQTRDDGRTWTVLRSGS